MTLVFRNRQRLKPVDLAAVRQILLWAAEHLLQIQSLEVCIHLVADPEMTRVNEHFLQHEGPTDVITFDYREVTSSKTQRKICQEVSGELYVCVPEAVRNARVFRTEWSSELVRYMVHGLLHLQGYDDRTPSVRRVMKREENRIIQRLQREFSLASVRSRKRKRKTP